MAHKVVTGNAELYLGDCRDILRTLPAESVHCCVTSPPYFGLRDYGHDGQIGLEPTPDEFVDALVAVFREVRRVLRDDGTLWLNLGDTYVNHSKPGGGYLTIGKRNTGGSKYRPTPVAGLAAKNLIGIPWRVAFALQADGWYLRQDIIWHKANPMPESVRDRCTKAHEYIFLLSKSPRYYFDSESVKEEALHPTVRYKSTRKTKSQEAAFLGNAPTNLGRCGTAEGGMRNRRSVWTVATKPFKGAHFATFPPDLIEPCVLAGAPVGGVVLDPFGGAGTTGLVANRHGRLAILCELNPEYVEMARKRIASESAVQADINFMEAV